MNPPDTLQEVKVEYIGSYTVPDGYFGNKAVVHLCFDPKSGKTLAAHPQGYYTTQIHTAVDAREVLWLLDHHPDCKNIQSI